MKLLFLHQKWQLIAVVLIFFAGVGGQTEEGDECTLKETDQIGTCTLIDNCPYAKELLKKGVFPQTCGFSINRPRVCCIKSEKPVGFISKKKCEEYQDARYSIYGIFGGVNAKPRVYLHMAALGYGEPGVNLRWQCGGSLISKRFVLTAAHCVNSRNLGPVSVVRLGELDLNSTSDQALPNDHRLQQVHVHPAYRPPSHYDDIALLQLTKDANIGLFVRPACLHLDLAFDGGQALDFNRDYIITGWGKTDFAAEASSHLLEARVRLVEQTTCAKRYEKVSKERLDRGIVKEKQICAGDLEGRDTCPGDSGGPLQYFVPSTQKLQPHFVIIGITSFGKGCGARNSVGVYARVSQYIDWIENIVWPNGS